jgi:hypothetical protein
MFSNGVGKGVHHDTLESFTEAAAEGCYICGPLLKHTIKGVGSLEDYYDFGRVYSFYFTFFETNYSDFRLFTINMPMEIAGERARTITIVPQARLPVRTSVYGRGPVIPMNECLPVAQEWMSSCLDKHEQCQKHTQPHTYPTRLLELEAHECRLILPQYHERLGPYAALSYCWGPNPKFLRLTSDNLQEFRSGIPYTSLPIAFQEAILIIRELGIQYLWIDALCIMQSGFGSIEDWQSECGRMQEVYSNCILNLSLAQATHPDQSCLRGYDLDSTLPVETNAISRTSDRGPLETDTYTVLSADYFADALYKQPIGRRAWVMQERLLATRVLSIGHGELFWDCNQVPYASESLPYGFKFCSQFQRSRLHSNLELSIPFVPHTPGNEDLVQTWLNLLGEYTMRKLTHPEADKLAAISAIAMRIGYAMNDTYLSGHFLKTLPGSLNWCARRSVSSNSHVEERAHKRLSKSSGDMIDDEWVITPSWSWASMDGPLYLFMTARNASWAAAMEAYEFSTVRQKGPEARAEKKLLLIIRAWCRIIEWTAGRMNDDGHILINIESLGYISYSMDDMQELPQDGSQYLLAALCSEHDSATGLLLKEIGFDGKKIYGRKGHFKWFFDDTNKDVGADLETYFPHGERSITLC